MTDDERKNVLHKWCEEMLDATWLRLRVAELSIPKESMVQNMGGGLEDLGMRRLHIDITYVPKRGARDAHRPRHS